MIYLVLSFSCGRGFPFRWKPEHVIDDQKMSGGIKLTVHRWKWAWLRLDYALTQN